MNHRLHPRRRLAVVAIAALAAVLSLAVDTPAAEGAQLRVGSRGPAVLALNERLPSSATCRGGA